MEKNCNNTGTPSSYHQGGVTTIIVQQAPPVNGYSHYKGKEAVVLGIVQLMAGLLSLGTITASGIYDINTNTYEHMALVMIFGYIIGYPSAIFFIISGSIAIASGKRKSLCLIIGTMVLSIIAICLFNMAYLIFYCCTFLWITDLEICEDGYYHVGCSQNIGVVVSCALCVVLAVVYLGAALGSVIVAGHVLCCQSKDVQPSEDQALVYHQQQQQHQGYVNPDAGLSAAL